MGGGGQVVGQVAQVVFDPAEGLVFGKVNEALGHAAEDLFGVGPELAEEGLDTGFAVIGGLRRGGNSRVQHGDRPGVTPKGRFGFPVAS
jgi:hypothetical protein